MGYSASIEQDATRQSWSVVLQVNLTRAESNDLFLSGDSIVSWPAEGLMPASADCATPERTGMFVSEVAARPLGLSIGYREKSQAERALTLLRAQFGQIGIEEEI